MKKWKKIVLILSTVAVLFVSVFAVSSSAITSIPNSSTIDIHKFTFGVQPATSLIYYDYDLGRNMFIGAGDGMIPDLDSEGHFTSGTWGAHGDVEESVYFRWICQDVVNTRFGIQTKSQNVYGINMFMYYRTMNGIINGSYDMGFTASVLNDTDNNFTIGSTVNSELPTSFVVATVYVDFIQNGEKYSISYDLKNTGNTYYLTDMFRDSGFNL